MPKTQLDRVLDEFERAEVCLERLYTVDEAAGFLRVHANSVRRYIKSGVLLATRVGGKKRGVLRIKERDLLKMLNDG